MQNYKNIVKTVSSIVYKKEIEKNYKVTAKRFAEDGIRLKILSEKKPFTGATPCEITLEDAYIYMNNK